MRFLVAILLIISIIVITKPHHLLLTLCGEEQMSRSTSMEKHFFLRPALCLHLLIVACFLTLLCFIWNCEGFTQKTKCKYFTAIQINAFSLQALSPPPNIIEVKTDLFGHSQLEKELNFPQFFYRFIYSRKQSNDIVGWLSLGH